MVIVPGYNGAELYYYERFNDREQIVSESSREEVSTIVCSDNFYFDNSSQLCKPECGVWTHLTPSKGRVVLGL